MVWKIDSTVWIGEVLMMLHVEQGIHRAAPVSNTAVTTSDKTVHVLQWEKNRNFLAIQR
jgi:hypothetical protein